MTAMLSVGFMELNEEGREDEEEDVGEGVDKLSNIRRDCVVIFTPVNGRGATLNQLPINCRHYQFTRQLQRDWNIDFCNLKERRFIGLAKVQNGKHMCSYL